MTHPEIFSSVLMFLQSDTPPVCRLGDLAWSWSKRTGVCNNYRLQGGGTLQLADQFKTSDTSIVYWSALVTDLMLWSLSEQRNLQPNWAESCCTHQRKPENEGPHACEERAACQTGVCCVRACVCVCVMCFICGHAWLLPPTGTCVYICARSNEICHPCEVLRVHKRSINSPGWCLSAFSDSRRMSALQISMADMQTPF